MKLNDWLKLGIVSQVALLCIQLAGCGEVPAVSAVEEQQGSLTCGTIRGIAPLGMNRTIASATAYWVPGSPLPAVPATVGINNANQLQRDMFGAGQAWNAPKRIFANWEFGTWTSANAPVPGALAPGPNGQCYAYYRTVGGFMLWPDNHNDPIDMWAYKIFPAAPNGNGIRYIERFDQHVPGVNGGPGVQLTINGQVQ